MCQGPVGPGNTTVNKILLWASLWFKQIRVPGTGCCNLILHRMMKGLSDKVIFEWRPEERQTQMTQMSGERVVQLEETGSAKALGQGEP